MGKPYKIKRHKRIYRRSAGSILLRVLVIVAAVAILFGLGWALYAPVSNWIEQRQNASDPTIGASEELSSAPEAENMVQTPETSAPPESSPVEAASEQSTAKMTAYLPIETVTDPQLFAAALSSAKANGYDSVMFDLKASDGTVHYPISYSDSVNGKVTGTKTIDLNAAVLQIKDAGLIPVASIYTFRDHLYPSADNSAGTRYMDSDFLWVDNDPSKGGKAWINPFSQSGQDYIQKIVDDACNAGFQSIVLQGMQFPEGYSLNMIDYGEHASDDKNAFLQQYLRRMTDYAEQQGAELTALFPAPSILGANNAMYFGDTAAIAGDTVAVDLRLSIFGSGLQTDLVSIPNPSADPYNTIKTAGAAVRSKLPQQELIAMIDGAGLNEDQLSSYLQGTTENKIERCIVAQPNL